MNTKIKQMLEELDKLEKDLINDLNNIDINKDKELHDNIIRLSAKYPEQGDILKFILLINDLQNTSRANLENIYLDSFSEIVKKKKSILNLLSDIVDEVKKNDIEIKQKYNPKYDWKKILFNFTSKLTPSHFIWIGVLTTSILFMIFIIEHPDKSEKAFEAVKSTPKIIQKKF